VGPAVLLAILLTITLANDNNQHELLLWCTAVIASKAYAAINARRKLVAGIPREKVRREVARLGLMHFVYGVIWGSLAWITLDNIDVTGNVLVLAVLAGVLGNAVALLSPVLPVFMSLCWPRRL